MKICFFNLNRLDYEGGAEKYFVDMAEELTKIGHKVFFVCNSDFYVRIRPRIENFIYRIIRAPLHKKFKDAKKARIGTTEINTYNLSLLFHLPFSKQRRRIKKVLMEAEIIYCKNEFIDSTYLRWLIGKQAFSKVVLGMHTAIFLERAASFHAKLHNILYFSRIYQKNLQLCGAIHVINNTYKKKLPQRYNISELKTVFIPNGLAEEEFNKNPAKNNQYLKILFAGRFTEQKGVDYLETIITDLVHYKEFPKMEFIIAGSGELEEIPRLLSKRFANVKFVGFIKDMKELYQQVDIAIVPSRWEMFPYSCLEPQANSVPVVAFDVPGPRDIIIEKITGRLIPLGDIKKFSQAILELFGLKKNNSSLFQEMRAKARQNAWEKFSLNKIAERIITLFNQVRQNYDRV